MINLIIKDIILQRKTLLLGLLYTLFMVIAFNNGGAAMFTASTFAVTFLLIQTPCAYDDKSRADGMLNSLPIHRNTIVKAKFLSIILYTVIAMAEYLAVFALLALLPLPIKATPVTLENTLGLLFSIALFSSIFYPVYFRFGYMKTRYLNVFVFCGLFAAGSALVAIIGRTGSGFGQSISAYLESRPDWMIAYWLIGLILLMMLTAYTLSIRFYRQREF